MWKEHKRPTRMSKEVKALKKQMDDNRMRSRIDNYEHLMIPEADKYKLLNLKFQLDFNAFFLLQLHQALENEIKGFQDVLMFLKEQKFDTGKLIPNTHNQQVLLVSMYNDMSKLRDEVIDKAGVKLDKGRLFKENEHIDTEK